MQATKYRIENPRTGVILGEYVATSKSDALDKLARDAGYDGYYHACVQTGDDPYSTLTVEEIPDRG
jgi:hypothetical protein